LLDVLAGYGYKPGRTVFAYISTILSFAIISLSLHFSKVSLKEKMPSGIKQVISKPFEHKIVAQLAS
jgi:hypothetical protein